VLKSELHGGLAPHGVTDEVGFMDPVEFHEKSKIVGQRLVAVLGDVRGAPMVALVDEEDLIVLAEQAPHCLPIVESTEQAVEDDEGVALAEYFVVEIHYLGVFKFLRL
jgi:hypothetical protein